MTVGNLCARSGVAFPAREPAPWRQSRLIVRCVPAHTCQHQHPRSRTENLFLLLVSLRLRRPPLCCSVAAGPLAVVLVVVAVSRAACGGSPSRRVWRASARRRHRAPVQRHRPIICAAAARAPLHVSRSASPFPRSEQQRTRRTTNQINPSSPTFLRAYTACRKYAPSGGAGLLHRPPPNCALRSRSLNACTSTGSRSSPIR